jgi:cytochrome P450
MAGPVERCPARFGEFDLHDPAQAEHLNETLAEMRATCPVAHSERWGGQWVLTAYEDVATAAKQPTVFSSRQGATHPRHSDVYEPLPISLDPPEHGSVRGFLQPHFSRAAVEPLRATLETFVSGLIDELIDAGECDAVESLALPVPLTGLATVMQVPAQELPVIRSLWLTLKDTSPVDDPVGRRAANDALFDYLERLVESKRGAADEGVMTAIANGQIDGRPITREQALGMAYLLMVAGHDTTVAGIAWMLYYLASDVAIRHRLIAEPELMPGFVDEILRFDGPVPGMARTTTTEVSVGDVTIPAGEHVLLMYASANRDEARFEHADEIRLDRTRNPHVAFGTGIHRCLGEHMARLEMRVVLEAVLARLPGIHLAGDDGLDVRPGFVRGPSSFRIRW